MVRLNLSQLEQFLKKVGSKGFKTQLHHLAELVLQNTWATQVMTKDYKQVYKISTKADMANMIRAGNYSPKKASYNPVYLKYKKKGYYFPYTANLPPHVLTGNLYNSIAFNSTPERVTMQLQTAMSSTQPPQTPRKYVKTEGAFKKYTTMKDRSTVKVFNYFLKHEQEKSILKSTFVLGWQDMMKFLMDFIKETAESVKGGRGGNIWKVEGRGVP